MAKFCLFFLTISFRGLEGNRNTTVLSMPLRKVTLRFLQVQLSMELPAPHSLLLQEIINMCCVLRNCKHDGQPWLLFPGNRGYTRCSCNGNSPVCLQQTSPHPPPTAFFFFFSFCCCCCFGLLKTSTKTSISLEKSDVSCFIGPWSESSWS